MKKLSILTGVIIFIALKGLAFADLTQKYEHVALLKCDQSRLRFDILVIGKGNAKIVSRDIDVVKNLYLFNAHTIKEPTKYRLCLVCLSRSPGELCRRITWIDPDKDLLSQFSNLGVEMAQRLLDEYEKSQELSPPITSIIPNAKITPNSSWEDVDLNDYPERFKQQIENEKMTEK